VTTHGPDGRCGSVGVVTPDLAPAPCGRASQIVGARGADAARITGGGTYEGAAVERKLGATVAR
jgi:hypothetical protein